MLDFIEISQPIALRTWIMTKGRAEYDFRQNAYLQKIGGLITEGCSLVS